MDAIERDRRIYEFRGFVIPDYMMDGLRMYIDHGVEPGSFLTAVICNDLSDACGRADETNLRNLPAFVAYLYNEAPSPCWGSRAKMDAWMERAALMRETAATSKAVNR